MGSGGGAVWKIPNRAFGLGLEQKPTSVVTARKLHREEPGD